MYVCLSVCLCVLGLYVRFSKSIQCGASVSQNSVISRAGLQGKVYLVRRVDLA